MKRFFKLSMFPWIIVAVLVTLFLKTGGTGAASPLRYDMSHSLLVPNAGARPPVILNGIAVVSPHDIWAVGNTTTSTGFQQTLIEHWNGQQWSVISSPNPGVSASLNGVAVVSSHDVWAVGTASNSTGAGTLIEHWNGRKWNIVPSPNPASVPYSILNGVAVVSAYDIWAVGFTTSSGPGLIEHWNGKSWSIVASPNPAGSTHNTLGGVSVASAHNIWTVGYTQNSNSMVQTLIEHWNGQQWSVVSSPNSAASSNNFLIGVAVASAHNVWTVGEADLMTLIEHWNGQQWNIVPSPNPLASNFLNEVAVASVHDIWTVGGSNSGTGTTQTLIEHWNGQQWSVVSNPNPSDSSSSILSGVAVVSPHDVWAVGSSVNSTGTGHTLIEHWNGQQWSIVQSA